MKVICSVVDTISGVYGTPVCVPSRASAMRSFKDAIRAEGSELHMHPADFDLLALADFDEESGKLTPFDVPEKLLSGAALAVITSA